MLITGCDYRPGFQQITWVDSETAECGEQQLIRKSGVKLARHRQIWPENGHLAPTFLQQSLDLRGAQPSSPEVLAYEYGVGFSLSTCEGGQSFLARG